MPAPRTLAAGAALLAVACALTACSAHVQDATPSTSSTHVAVGANGSTAHSSSDKGGAGSSDTSSSQNTHGIPVVPGYDVGQFPAIPLIKIPDISVLDATQQTLADTINTAITDIPGLTIEPARCDANGSYVRTDGTVLYGDGSGSYVGADGSVSNYGDGSGSFTDDDSTTSNYGDGSGSYTDANVSISNYGDGSGSYTDDEVSVSVYGDGSGSYTDANTSISNYGDGSGSYTDANVSISNYGDGSGSYTDDEVSISNYGDGTGTVNGVDVKVEPIPDMPPMGTFPPLEALTPLAPVCGTLITLPDSVLFDFGNADLRSDAGPVLDAVAQALVAVPDLAQSLTVAGHTDSISSDEFNQDLSERRADAVADALTDRDVTSSLDAVGYGETQPVAQNEINGADNPAGRALNRRVEIIIPSA